MTRGELGGTDGAWERLAQDDPLWAILSDPAKRGGGWQLDDFFATGEVEIGSLMRYLEAIVPGLHFGHALDFGCGVGRLTRALGRRFEHVTGVDVAQAMIDQAMRYNEATNVEFLLNRGTHLEAVQDGSVDLVYSSITLQHIPTKAALAYIRDFLRVLKPDGIAVFQLPARRRLNLKTRLTSLLPRSIRVKRSGGIEMHGVPREEVLRVISGAGGEAIDVREDESAGADWESYRYAMRRTRAP